MTVYEHLNQVAKKMDDISLSIELHNDPSVISDLKRERISLVAVADDVRRIENESAYIRKQCMDLKRLLFYELLRQREPQFIKSIKSIVGTEEFAWRIEHRLFSDQEISSVITKIFGTNII